MLGCLIEKQRTTPDGYPLSVNALRLACNQSTGRDPVVDYDDHTVLDALEQLGRRRWTRLASGAGSRARKYRQLLDRELPASEPELAVLCVLMLRGPQTPGELKQRTERLHPFADLAAVEDTLLGADRPRAGAGLGAPPGPEGAALPAAAGRERRGAAQAADAAEPPRRPGRARPPRAPRGRGGRAAPRARRAEGGAGRSDRRPPAAPLRRGPQDPERQRARALLRPGLRVRHHPGLAPPARAPDVGGRGAVGADAADGLVVVELHDVADQRAERGHRRRCGWW